MKTRVSYMDSILVISLDGGELGDELHRYPACAQHCQHQISCRLKSSFFIPGSKCFRVFDDLSAMSSSGKKTRKD